MAGVVICVYQSLVAEKYIRSHYSGSEAIYFISNV